MTTPLLYGNYGSSDFRTCGVSEILPAHVATAIDCSAAGVVKLAWDQVLLWEEGCWSWSKSSRCSDETMIPFPTHSENDDKKNKWHQMTCFINTSYLVGGFNPFEKYLSKWIISPSRDENKKYLKPPPSYGCQFPKKPDAMRGTALAPPSDRSGAPLGWASLPGDAASPRRCFKRNTLRIKHYIISKYIYIIHVIYVIYIYICDVTLCINISYIECIIIYHYTCI